MVPPAPYWLGNRVTPVPAPPPPTHQLSTSIPKVYRPTSYGTTSVNPLIRPTSSPNNFILPRVYRPSYTTYPPIFIDSIDPTGKKGIQPPSIFIDSIDPTGKKGILVAPFMDNVETYWIYIAIIIILILVFRKKFGHLLHV
jgi:hypothetical protein